jgi:GDP-L-fucose synthase
MDCEGSYTEIIFNILNNIKNGNNEVIIYGNPDEKVLDLVYVDDVVNAIILSTFNSNKHVFNVSTQDGVTISNLLKCVEEVTGVTLKINNLPENRTDIEPKRVGDISELKSLGWKAEVSLADGIRKTYEWIKTL